jgi:hypothetical protein
MKAALLPARWWILFALLPAALSLGCKKKPVAPAAKPAADSLPKNVDRALFEELTQLTKACKVDVAEGNLNCAQGEQRKLMGEFISDHRSRTASVATFAAALAQGNPPVKVVAANILYAAFRSPWGPKATQGSVSAEDADALLAATMNAPKNLARQTIPAAVHACMLANRVDAVYAALDKTPNADLRTNGIRYLMTQGRLTAFPKIQELAKDSNIAVVLAALDSPRNMYQWTSTEQAAICPWAASLVNDTRAAVATKASSLLGSCTGPYIDQLLASGESALAAGKFTAAQLTSYRDLCAPSARNQPNGPSNEQCARCRKLLGQVIEAKSVDDQTRISALISLAYQWPDDTTLKLCKRLATNKDKSLAEHAKRTIERLEQRQALEQKNKPKPR